MQLNVRFFSYRLSLLARGFSSTQFLYISGLKKPDKEMKAVDLTDQMFPVTFCLHSICLRLIFRFMWPFSFHVHFDWRVFLYFTVIISVLATDRQTDVMGHIFWLSICSFFLSPCVGSRAVVSLFCFILTRNKDMILPLHRLHLDCSIAVFEYPNSSRLFPTYIDYLACWSLYW